MMDEGRIAEARGRRITAREFCLRVVCFYGKVFHPHFGYPVDSRVIKSSRRQVDAFNLGLALGDDPAEPVRIPFFASVVSASRRRCHCLIFDGPRQGTTLIEHGVHLLSD